MRRARDRCLVAAGWPMLASPGAPETARDTCTCSAKKILHNWPRARAATTEIDQKTPNHRQVIRVARRLPLLIFAGTDPFHDVDLKNFARVVARARQTFRHALRMRAAIRDRALL